MPSVAPPQPLPPDRAAPNRDRLVACGLYASSAALQSAWRALFRQLPEFLGGGRRTRVMFRADDDACRDPALLLGHVCGYPWLKKWAASHRPVCAPLFAVDGCDGIRYSSWFVTATESALGDLESARGARVAINEPDSNSGMNVLRHAVAELGGGARFFGEVVMSGSHLHSLELIARGRVELAAVDAVTWALQAAREPALQKRIRIIAQSVFTTAPPFIAPVAPVAQVPESDHPAITAALNECLDNLDPEHREALQLRGFRQVSAADYAPLAALEQFAFARGYPEIA